MKTVIVTGGTGGLGAAVTGAFLDAGWRAVVPWVVEAEVERLEARPHLHLMKADLFDPESVQKVVERADEDVDAPLGAVVNLVGGYGVVERSRDERNPRVGRRVPPGLVDRLQAPFGLPGKKLSPREIEA